MLKYISTVNMSREDWLKHRKHSIGGSDAAAIIGLGVNSSPMTVWGDKTGRIPPAEENEAMRLGRDLEWYVAERWCEKTGKKVHRLNKMIYNTLYPYAHADIYRKVWKQNAGLECKTTQPHYETIEMLENGIFPKHYYVQCVHYMAVTKARRWYLAILALGKGFYHFVIERDEDEINALMAAEAEFWRTYIEADTPPPPDGSKATGDALCEMYSKCKPGNAIIDDDIVNRYYAYKSEKDNAVKKLETVKQELMLSLAEFETGSGDMYSVEWKKQQRKSYDVKRFMLEHPEIDMTPYLKITDYRVLDVK